LTPRVPERGPVITPSKQKSAKAFASTPSGARRIPSAGHVWTLPPVQPVVQSSPTASGSATMSFAAIQQLQREQDILPAKDKRSLKEIQEEEHAKQIEEEFLKWWAQEEERLKTEQEVPVQAQSSQAKAKGPGQRSHKGQRGQGKGKHPAAQSSSQNEGGGAQVQQQRPERPKPKLEKTLEAGSGNIALNAGEGGSSGGGDRGDRGPRGTPRRRKPRSSTGPGKEKEVQKSNPA